MPQLECTLYRIDTGEFETVVSVPQDDMDANVPDGYRVMLGRWDASEWRVQNDEPVRKPRIVPEPTIDDVNAEARRRIVERYPEWRQLNVIREGGDVLTAMTAFIDRIRTASDRLAGRQRIPSTFRDDRYWSVS